MLFFFPHVSFLSFPVYSKEWRPFVCSAFLLLEVDVICFAIAHLVYTSVPLQSLTPPANFHLLPFANENARATKFYPNSLLQVKSSGKLYP